MATTSVRRKLTAILSADVKGYSLLMAEDEEATVRTLTAYREVMSYSLLMAEDEEATVRTLTAYREVMSSLIQQFRGRVVDTPRLYSSVSIQPTHFRAWQEKRLTFNLYYFIVK
jgi:ribonuclease D